MVSRLNASNHLALIFFLIFIFIFNCFSLSFFSADVALSHYAKPFVFVIVLQLSFKVAFSRCVHVWMRAHTQTHANKFVCACMRICFACSCITLQIYEPNIYSSLIIYEFTQQIALLCCLSFNALWMIIVFVFVIIMLLGDWPFNSSWFTFAFITLSHTHAHTHPRTHRCMDTHTFGTK